MAGTVKTRESGQNPATRTFQAFRIFINAELEELERALEASLNVLAPGGHLVVISFHSLEDRIVKQFIAKHSREVVDRNSPDWMLRKAPAMKLQAIGRSKPSEAEAQANPRARSAVMRVARAWRCPHDEAEYSVCSSLSSPVRCTLCARSTSRAACLWKWKKPKTWHINWTWRVKRLDVEKRAQATLAGRKTGQRSTANAHCDARGDAVCALSARDD